MLSGQSCGSGDSIDIVVWDDGLKADRTDKGIYNCKSICNDRAECSGFDHHENTDICGLWKRAPTNPEIRNGYNCYQKISG